MMFSQTNLLLLQSGASGLLGFAPIILMFVAMYFLLILPQRKRQRQVQEMLNNLKVNDKVITSGGIHGVITMVREDGKTLQLKIADNPAVRIEVSRSAIAGLQGGEELNK